MSVEDIKSRLNSMSEEERRQVSIHLSKLRSAADEEHRALIAARLDDKDPSHWLTLDEFERRLDER